MTHPLDTLLERLEGASEGSREFDAEIAALCHPTDDPQYAAFENGRDYPDLYTSSVDAAISLVPEGYIRLERYSDGWYVTIKPHSQDKAESVGTQKPAALALCIAIFHALRARRTTLAGEE